jgi:hypothetical protein
MTPAQRALSSKILSVVLSGGIGIGAGVLIRRTLLDSPKADSAAVATATQPARKAKEHPPFSTKAGEPDEVAMARLLRTASLEDSLELIPQFAGSLWELPENRLVEVLKLLRTEAQSNLLWQTMLTAAAKQNLGRALELAKDAPSAAKSESAILKALVEAGGPDDALAKFWDKDAIPLLLVGMDSVSINHAERLLTGLDGRLGGNWTSTQLKQLFTSIRSEDYQSSAVVKQIASKAVAGLKDIADLRSAFGTAARKHPGSIGTLLQSLPQGLARSIKSFKWDNPHAPIPWADDGLRSKAAYAVPIESDAFHKAATGDPAGALKWAQEQATPEDREIAESALYRHLADAWPERLLDLAFGAPSQTLTPQQRETVVHEAVARLNTRELSSQTIERLAERFKDTAAFTQALRSAGLESIASQLGGTD